MTALPNNEVASKGCSQAVIALTAANLHTAQRKHRKDWWQGREGGWGSGGEGKGGKLI